MKDRVERARRRAAAGWAESTQDEQTPRFECASRLSIHRGSDSAVPKDIIPTGRDV